MYTLRILTPPFQLSQKPMYVSLTCLYLLCKPDHFSSQSGLACLRINILEPEELLTVLFYEDLLFAQMLL
eukprot:XP_001710025.1 Hypothetical protein GL50803_101528 [Giardia lamblia ATCC 50803]